MDDNPMVTTKQGNICGLVFQHCRFDAASKSDAAWAFLSRFNQSDFLHD